MSTPHAYADAVELIHDSAPLIRLAREHHRSERGAPILFADKPYLPALLADLPRVREASFRKAVQTGISEALIMLILYESGWRGRICAYALPDNKITGRFVTKRIDKILAGVPAYRAKLPFGTDPDRKAQIGNVAMKTFGSGTMLFLGAETPSNWVEFSADTFVIDELDWCNAEHVAMAPDRVKASAEPRLIYVGNPTTDGIGIDYRFTSGSRGYWFQRCTRCGHRQVIDWFVNVVERDSHGRWFPFDRQRLADPSLGDLRPLCVRCRQLFERTSGGGAWGHERPVSTMHPASFCMTHLDMLSSRTGHHPYREMLSAWLLAQTQDELLVKFYQSKLAQPKRAMGASLTVEMLRAASLMGRSMDPTGESTAGKMLVLSSDVGSTFHITVREIHEDMDVQVGYRAETRWVGTARSWTELTSIHERYNPGISVVDAGPEGTAAREWCAKMEARLDGCQAYRCAFHKGAHVAGSDLAFHKSTRDRLVTVDRTQAMDRAFYDIRDGLHVLPSDIFTTPGWSTQMCVPVRQVRDDGTVFWSKGEDHYRLSDTYGRVGLQIAAKSGCLPSPARS